MGLRVLCGVVACAASVVAAVEWEDPSVNAVNRLSACAFLPPLADEAAALSDDLEPATPYVRSLNGNWKISWCGDPALRPLDFWKTDYDDSQWFTIDVPSCVEMRGFGTPGYTNVRYPHAWDPKRDIAAPTIRDRDTDARDYNPVSSYRTRFTVPAAWAGRDVILRFDGVYSAYSVWVNGHKVGYAEDSFTTHEFELTDYLNYGGSNSIAVKVYRWCDGSYLEDQDMFRFSGIFRDVTLWAKPKDGIWDFTVQTELSTASYAFGRVNVAGCDLADAKLFDADGKLVGTPAVIDKDFASAKLAELLDADMLVILTAVEKVAINFGKPDQKGLDELTPAEAKEYIAQGQFAKGSMLPKVEAAVKFAESKSGRTALITLLEKAKDGIEGKTGTRVHQ
mgnify:CR=1 FL=1